MKYTQLQAKIDAIRLANTCSGPIIGPSTIPLAGFGLFAEKDYLEGEIICIYGGERLEGM